MRAWLQRHTRVTQACHVARLSLIDNVRIAAGNNNVNWLKRRTLLLLGQVPDALAFTCLKLQPMIRQSDLDSV